MGQREADSEELRKKVAMLKAEGVEVREGKVLHVDKVLLTALTGKVTAEDMTDERLAAPLTN